MYFHHLHTKDIVSMPIFQNIKLNIAPSTNDLLKKG